MHRKRAAQACLPCKQSKKRCDCRIPCLHCLKKNDGGACIYASDRPRIPGVVNSPRPAAPLPPVENVPDGPTGSASLPPRASQTPNQHQRQSGTPTATGHAAKMLSTSKGSRVYVGDSASLSFLHLVRDMLTRYMGPSTFTNSTKTTFMLETSRGTDNAMDYQCSHGRDELNDLINHCYATTSGVLDVLKRHQLTDYLSSHPSIVSDSSLQDAVVHAMLAIGAQSRGSLSDDLTCQHAHLAKAQKISFENMLEDPSLDQARVFLLLGFYMLGASRRNAAFMYVGVAARAAYALGLHHHDSYRCMSIEEKTTRLKTWKSVRILDLLVSTVLGRPPATSDVETTALAEQDLGDDRDIHRRQSLDATYEVWSIIDVVVRRFYRQQDFDIAAARTFLGTLEGWSQGVGPMLKSRTTIASSDRVKEVELVVGNVHVACSYYYAVMLATRKSLITHLTTRLLSAAGDLPEGATRTSSNEESLLAKTCIESAILTCQTCREVLDADLLLENMSLLTAWIFSAAMIIGFDLFTQDQPDRELDQSLSGAIAVLEKLGRGSPQAKHYWELLTNLRQAIGEHRQRGQAGMAFRKTYVTKIFSIGGDQGDASWSLHDQNAVPAKPFSIATASGGVDQQDQTGDDDPTESGMMFEDIDSVAAQLWDEFLLGQDFGVPTHMETSLNSFGE